MRIKTTVFCSILIVLFHGVGLAGFLIPTLTTLFIKLIPFHLVLMFALIIISHQKKNTDFGLFVVISCLAGFLVELVGVSTGVIFGSYRYGSALGLKVTGVPPVIGLNWFILIYSTGMLVRNFQIKSYFIRSLVGAGFLVLLDILIEPIAIKFDYWQWDSMAVPFINYVAWFVFSFIMLRIFFELRFHKRNIAGSIMFVIQLLFFAALNLWAF